MGEDEILKLHVLCNLDECYKIQDGHHFNGKKTREKNLFGFFFRICRTDHNKFTIK